MGQIIYPINGIDLTGVKRMLEKFLDYLEKIIGSVKQVSDEGCKRDNANDGRIYELFV